MLNVHNLSVRYPDSELYAISNINLTFNKGEFVCILGKSGSGKSTLIRCLNGLQQPTQGNVFYNSTSLSIMKEHQLRTVRRDIGMIFQHFNLVPRLTVLQNVLAGLFGYRSTLKNITGWFSKEELSRARQAIADVELTDQINRRVEKLSGGQKQRVGIARALVQRPEMFLGDEPVSSLDPGTSKRIFSLLHDIYNRHNLLMMVNVHDVNLAKDYATRIIALKDGAVIFDDVPEAFTSQVFEYTYESEKVSIKN